MTIDEAIKILKQTGGVINPIVHPVKNYMASEVYEAVNLAIKVLEERPTGRWLRTDDMFETLVCSECDYDTGDYIRHNFCPNCGAKMKGEKE